MNTVRIKNDYLIYLDNTRIDHLVTNFNTSHVKDAGMPTASVTMQVEFGRGMTDAEYNSTFSKYRDDIYKLKDTLKEKTNLVIFVRNVVSGGYNAIFNGNVSDLFISTNRSKRVIAIQVSALGGIAMLHEIESILAIPFKDLVLNGSTPISFKLAARTLNVAAASMLANIDQINMQRMTIKEMLGFAREVLYNTNQTYTKTMGVVNFNSVIDRIRIFSDISPDLLTSGILDAGFTTNALVVETLYQSLAKQMGRLMLEFFEMPHGEIVIKAPYWNAPVLFNHIIPDIFIISDSMQQRFSGRVTRMLVQGNVAQEDASTEGYAAQFTMPMAAYTEDLDGNGQWASLQNFEGATNIGAFSRPTNAEMYYGVKFAEEFQPVIKFPYGFASADSAEIIKRYAAYRYRAINANTATMSLTLMAMPWLKPGVNTWVDPTGINEIYYVSSVSHTGSPDGVYTTAYLTMGRPSEKFFTGGTFSSLYAGGTTGSNVFVTRDNATMQQVFAGQPMVDSAASYNAMAAKMANFKANPGLGYNADQNPMLTELFSPKHVGMAAKVLSPSNMSQLNLNMEFSESETQTMLNNLFNNTSADYAKKRAYDISKFIGGLKLSVKRT